MDPTDENLQFWLKMENGLKFNIPDHIKNTLKYKTDSFFLFQCNIKTFITLYYSSNGFGSLIAFEDFNDEDIESTENFVRTQLGELLKKVCARNGKPFNDDIKKSYFGDFGDCIKDFRYSVEEKQLIFKCTQYTTYLSRIEEMKMEFGHFGFDDNDSTVTTAIKKDVAPHSTNCVSQTHFVLNLLLKPIKTLNDKKKVFVLQKT